MGWVGVVGVLIALVTIAFSQYSMWSFSSLFSRSATREPTATQGQKESDDDDVKQSNSEARAQEETAETAETSASSETDSAQTTPKASASAPVLQVPELTLNENNKAASSDRPRQDLNPTVSQTTKPTHSSKPQINTQNGSSLMPPPPSPLPRMPAPNQAQRPPSLKPLSSQSNQQLLSPPKTKVSAPLRTPPSAAASLRNPAAGGGLSTSTLAPPQRSRQVVLGPGHSPLDWATLSKDPRNNLRGAGLPPTLIKVTPSMLKAHNGRKGSDAWTSYNGKVYNVSPYIPFHPGGKGELLRGAGKDSAKLFLETHPWVNWEGILGECMVGILVSENDRVETNEMDAMD